MANQEIDDFSALAVAPAVGDLLPIVDVSDTTDSAQGTTKKITVANLLAIGAGPTGAAGGVLSGTYPNPGFAVDMATQAELDAVAGSIPAGGPATQIDETGGPTTLDIAAIADGEYLKRSGTDIIGDTPGAGSVFAGGEFDQYKLMSFTSRPGTTTLDPVNAAAAATASGGGVSAVTNANGAFIRYTSAGSLDADAGWHANNTALLSDIACLPQTVTKLMTYTSIAVVRFWIGMFDSSPLGSADPAVSGAGFRFDTSASDANWQAWTNDGSGGGTVTDTGIAVSTSTLYHLSIKVVSASSIEFYISTNNGASYSLVATHTTNLPATGVPFNYYSMLRTLEAVVKSIQHGWTHIRVR